MWQEKHQAQPALDLTGPTGITALLAPLQQAIAAEVERLQAARDAAGLAETAAGARHGELDALGQAWETLTRSVASLEQQERTARRAATQAETARLAATTDLEHQRQQLAGVERELAAARGVLRELQQQRELAEANTRGAVGVLKAQQEFAERAARLAVVGAEEARHALNQAQTEQAVAEQQLLSLREQVAQARHDADQTRADVAAARSETALAHADRAAALSAAQIARHELAALREQQGTLQRQVDGLSDRERLLAALPEPVQALLADLPERLRERATDSLFVRLPAVDREALERAAKLQRAKVQEIVRDALRNYLGQETYRAALEALNGGAGRTSEG